MDIIQIQKAQVFLKHLAKSYQKHKKKSQSKEELKQHLEKIKKNYASKKPSKRKISSDFKKLEKHISNVVELEKSTHKVKPTRDDVKYRIEQLNSNMKKYVDIVNERKQKIKNLEKKIKQKAQKNKQIYPKYQLKKTADKIELRQRLYGLEDKYLQLKSRGFSEEKLEPIKEKIEELKEKI